ncbi:MAG: divalent cation tolerance protein CutA [Candidatus Saccharibacteria bacterium]|nr:divalent cation tolerance protein CutA [Candidatus Saccharibacteria bacterium]
MISSNFCYAYLTCATAGEAFDITSSLLEKKLVACVKQLPVKSDFLWNGTIDQNNEILLIMESREDLFDQIEAEVTKIHSYETFVLTAIPMNRVSQKAQKWLSETLTQ